ncbi:MAG: outer membrane lipoprotein-sorting protein [Myxococcales bacterium]|nr:outer membrane lipoprotein-sorting protein [Myxococcales bacterium]
MFNWKRLSLAVLLGVGCLLAATAHAQEMDGNAILRKADDVANAMKDLKFDMTMILVDKSGIEKKRVLRVWQKDKKRMTKFMEPATERGMAVLVIDDQTSFTYLPAYKKVRRIASHVRNQSLMGADFSQEDLSTTHLSNDYNADLLETTADNYLLKLTPKPDKMLSYSKLEITLQRNTLLITQLKYFDKISGKHVKTEDRENFTTIKGYTAPRHVKMTDLASGHYTTIDMTNVEYDTNISEDIFTTRYLRRPEK